MAVPPGLLYSVGLIHVMLTESSRRRTMQFGDEARNPMGVDMHCVLKSTLTTPHYECLAMGGTIYRRNCRLSRSCWRHQSVGRAVRF